MKRNFLALLAFVAMAAISCRSEQEYPDHKTTAGEMVSIQLTPTLPNNIAPLSSNQGGTGTLDPSRYALRYLLEVWKEGDTAPVLRDTSVASGFTAPVNFNISLPAMEYQFVFWADFTDKNNPEADLTYKTDKAGGLTDIEWSATAYTLANNLRDAYYATETIDMTTTAAQTISLRRPFGKLRILATDLHEAITGGDNFKAALTYINPTAFRKSFNALMGMPNAGTIAATGTYECTPTPEASVTVGENTYNNVYLLAFDYFFVPADLTAMAFDLQLFHGTDMAESFPVKSVSNVPVGVNKLTTVIGAFIPDNSTDIELIVGIDDDFTGEHETPPDNSLSLSENSLSFVAAGEAKTFDIISNTAWTVVSSEAWCTVSAGSGSHNATLTLTAAANTEPAARTATLTVSATGVADQTIALTQKAAAAENSAFTKVVWDFTTIPASNPISSLLSTTGNATLTTTANEGTFTAHSDSSISALDWKTDRAWKMELPLTSNFTGGTIQLSFQAYSAGPGPRDFAVEWSADNNSWSTATYKEQYALTSNPVHKNICLTPSGLTNKLYLRLRVTSNSSVRAGTGSAPPTDLIQSAARSRLVESLTIEHIEHVE
jgi:hypothetical protein